MNFFKSYVLPSIVIILIVIGIILVVVGSSPADDTSSGTVSSTTVTTVSSSEVHPQGATEVPVPGSAVPTTTTAPSNVPSTAPHVSPAVTRTTSSGRASLVFPYSTVVLSTEYVIGWEASSAVTATLFLTHNGKDIAPLSGCTNMSVLPGSTKYCRFELSPSGYSSTDVGYGLKLVTYNTGGTEVSQVSTAPFSLATESSILYQPYKQSMAGWSVRYPENWHVHQVGNATTFAATAADLTNPYSSIEAFKIDFCSTARESCVARVDTFIGASKGNAATVGGKQSARRIFIHEGMLIREDMIIKSSIAYFVSRIVPEAGSESFSPFVRRSLEQFDFTPGRIDVLKYALNGSFTAGSLLLELTDDHVSFSRLFTAERGCSIEIASSSFTETQPRLWRFTENACIIEGFREPDGSYTVTTDDCEPLEVGECRFAGHYRPG